MSEEVAETAQLHNASVTLPEHTPEPVADDSFGNESEVSDKNDTQPSRSTDTTQNEGTAETTESDMPPAEEASTNESTQHAEEIPPPKSRRLKKQTNSNSQDTKDSQDDSSQQIDGSIKIPKKKTQRKKNNAKKNADPDGDFVPPSGPFEKNYLDADDYSDDDYRERKTSKKKQVSAGKIYFDEVIKRVKERRKKNVQLTTEECQIYCRQLVERMIAAAADDVTAMKQGRPGLAKLKMINDISEFSKPAWRNWCIAEGGAVALASWITPLPDGSLPNLSVRTKVLQMALLLPFQANDLRDNDLGRQIVALWKHPDECESNRILIRSIVQKWVRPMLGLASTYSDVHQDFPMPIKPTASTVGGGDKDRKTGQKFPPRKTQMGSIIVNQERINSKLTQMFRVIESRRRAPAKATKVSVDGAII
ncbi:Protein IWS1 -like protein A [Babesia sp. Xinjiang]|uniref:Protein IWS1 -like protein A n=1 Tax=Babesia sp. Xinjiang TaxID=462227 RepID=UPI000A2210F0|nr:Protein IWS1 -like protein A [Babesia sp. Xinjiang]ORM40674.1 Protein IWS1 -like protein A [Babesia sp. Xinjiang]